MISTRLSGCGIMLLLAIFFDSTAQTTSQGRGSVLPSPDAIALGRYGDVPVSYYTGRPTVTIPLTQISEGALTIPIALSYYSGGHKVDETASWVGLGWTLTCDAVITRVVHGLPDEVNSQWSDYVSKPINSIFDGTVLTDSERVAYLESVNKGCIDIERDIYYFNINGNSGKFFLDFDGKVITNSNKPVEIIPTFNNSGDSKSSNEIISWKVIDQFGTVYDFNDAEITSNASAPSCHPKAGNFISTWHLSKIKDVNGENEINFSYTTFQWATSFMISESRVFLADSPTQNIGTASDSQSQLRYTAKRLNKISTGHTGIEVEFLLDAKKRSDVWELDNYEVKALKAIVLKYNGRENRTFSLVHSTAGKLSLTQVIETVKGKRIRPPFLFDYEGSAVLFNEKNQDHWGYYNKANNSTLVPLANVHPLNPMEEGYKLFDPNESGANREPNVEGSKNGILKRITYPTGSKTEFLYEQNDYSFIQAKDVESDEFYGTERFSNMISQTIAETNQTGNPTKSLDINIVQSGWVRVEVNGYGVKFPPRPSAEIIKDGQTIWRLTVTKGTFKEVAYLNLQSGTYTIKATAPLNDSEEASSGMFSEIKVDYLKGISTKIFKKPAGGVRLSETRDFPVEGSPIIRRFKYALPENPQKSSGVIYEEPKYSYRTTQYQNNSADPNEYAIDLAVRLSQNRFALGETQGSHIGYSDVTVEYIGEGNVPFGKTLYKFTTPREFPDAIIQDFPFAPPSEQGFKTGLLKQQIDFKKEGQVFTPVHKVINDYQFRNYEVPSQKIGFLGGYPGSPDKPRLNKYLIGSYKLNIGFYQVVKSTEEFLQSGQWVGRSSEIEYDADFQNVVIAKSKLSDDEEMISEYFYPQDFSTATPILQSLKDKHVRSLPIETIVKKKKGINEYVAGGTFNDFHSEDPTKIRVKSIYKLDLPGLLPVKDFVFSKDKSDATPDSHYTQEAVNDLYDAYGNLLQTTLRNGTVRSILLDYFLELPIAEVINAKVNEIAYTSFEADGKGGWNFESANKIDSVSFFTGTKSFNVQGTQITKGGLEIGKAYTLSYWTKGSALQVQGQVNVIQGETINDWTYFEHTIKNITSVVISTGTSGAQLIDELRLHPQGAMMTTFTYDPVSGRTSSTDINGRTTYFEYDLNRLKLIRDSDKNIVKFFDYQYKAK